MLNRITSNVSNRMQFFRSFTTTEKIYNPRPRIKHYVVSRDQTSDYNLILKEIMKVVNANKDSIIFLTQKSRVLVTQSFDSHHPGRPASIEEIREIAYSQSFKTVLQNQQTIPLFRPEAGHVCLTLTNDVGHPEEYHTVSLRPDTKRRIATGRSQLYRGLYSHFPATLYYSQHTSFQEEAQKLAKIISHPNSTTVADITVVPFSSSELTREQLIRNISKARATPIYNLCKTIFKEKALQNNNDISIQSCLDEMKRVANVLNFKEAGMLETDEIILVALACTNAAVEACFGDPHFLAKNVGMDLSTQATVTLCCAMNLVGEEEFFRFASSFGFYDAPVALIEDLDNDTIFKPRR